LNYVRKPADPTSHKLSALLAQEVAYQLILTWDWMHTQVGVTGEISRAPSSQQVHVWL
jgi:hypothetical protein